MPILEENFRWHLEAFASELFTHMLCVIQANYTMHIMNLTSGSKWVSSNIIG